MRITAMLTLVFTMCNIIGCTKKQQNTLEKNTIRIAIFPSSGGLSETYFFEIHPTGKCLVEFGTRYKNDLNITPFINKKYDYVSKNQELSNSEQDYIVSLVSSLYNKGVNTYYELIYDSWDIQVLYQGKMLQYNCLLSNMTEIVNLVEKLKEISPVEIDLHVFS